MEPNKIPQKIDFAKIAAECELYTITTDGEYAAFANGKQFQDKIDSLVSNGQLGDNVCVYAHEGYCSFRPIKDRKEENWQRRTRKRVSGLERKK